ncbi:MAG: 50S ribosomal protein L11 methyltransferase [Oscillospiraceae bacterium]|nr:50S ribosomal protein L11 methyltransferase [Oscillospiraceae bacterium]
MELNMDWFEILIKVPQELCEKASAIANMVVPYGIYVEDYSDLESAALEIAHIDLIDEELIARDRTHAIIHIYISKDENVIETLEFLKERFTSEKIEFTIDQASVKDSDWADNWKKFFKVTEIGSKLVIKPSWEEYENKNSKLVLNIDPGAAFGTGTHATTRMCLELLEEYVSDNKEMLDIGCGSGILSIAGALLGAKSVVGVDIDKTAIKVSRENAEINDMSDRTKFIYGNLCDDINDKYDVICANIVADVIVSLLNDIEKYMNDNAVFLCSGIIDIRESDVIEALNNKGFKILEIRNMDNWRAIAAKKA